MSISRASINIVPVILAGGSGTRLWPLSSSDCPKQFLQLYGEHSLLQNTLLRIANVTEISSPIVVCNDGHIDLVHQQLCALQITDACLITEPVGRNTAPAIAVAAMQALRLHAENDVLLLVLPADHIIDDVVKLHQAIKMAHRCALNDWLVCFGVLPTRPETGYGYIQCGMDIKFAVGEESGAFKVTKFVEKPDPMRAAEYLQAQNYYWNSGMFMLNAQRYLAELQQWAPDIFTSCRRVVKSSALKNHKVDGLTSTVMSLDKQEFVQCRSDSIDYAVMEHTAQAAVVPLDAGWSDIGSWLSLWECLPKDADGNVVAGNVIAKNCEDSYFNANARQIIAIGVKDLVIVEANGKVLILAKEQCQNFKDFMVIMQKK